LGYLKDIAFNYQALAVVPVTKNANPKPSLKSYQFISWQIIYLYF
jgi:hypothetical protein